MTVYGTCAMESLTLDVEKEGLLKVHSDYEVSALKTVWNSKEGLLTRDVWEILNNQKNIRISRASIINFLQDMADKGILRAIEEPCKGGSRKRYYPKMTESEYKEYIVKTVIKSLMKDFDETKEVLEQIISN